MNKMIVFAGKKNYCVVCKKLVAGESDSFNFQRGITMKSCEKCRFRGIYDKNPKSLLGRIWKWHIGWCPGWKSYLKSLSDEERDRLVKRYQ
jgi:hypothetical protein